MFLFLFIETVTLLLWKWTFFDRFTSINYGPTDLIPYYDGLVQNDHITRYHGPNRYFTDPQRTCSVDPDLQSRKWTLHRKAYLWLRRSGSIYSKFLRRSDWEQFRQLKPFKHHNLDHKASLVDSLDHLFCGWLQVLWHFIPVSFWDITEGSCDS